MSNWRYERVSAHPEHPNEVFVVTEGDEEKCRRYFKIISEKWDAGWDKSYGLARVVAPDGTVVAEKLAPKATPRPYPLP